MRAAGLGFRAWLPPPPPPPHLSLLSSIFFNESEFLLCKLLPLSSGWMRESGCSRGSSSMNFQIKYVTG